MAGWQLLTKGLAVSILAFAGFAVYRSGWLPVEFGGTQTGAVLDSESGSMRNHTPNNLGMLPEFEADDSLPPLDVCGRTTESLPNQSEPLIEESADSIPERSAGLRIPKELPDELVSELPSELADQPFDENAVQPALARLPARQVASKIRLVSAEEPTKLEAASEKRTARGQAADPNKSESDNSDESPAGGTGDEPPVRIAKRPNDASFDGASIDRQIKSGQIVEAHQALSKMFWQQPELRSQIQERIDLTAKAIYFSPQLQVEEAYVVQGGDQLRKIATKHHVPWPYLAKLNRTDPRRLREGQKLKVITGPFGAVVTLSDFELVLHHRGQYMRRYRICIGKNDSSPVGKFKVLNKVSNPQYTDPDGRVFAGDDPKNPLGIRWLDLGESYGIHGTIEPDSIGKAESRGCIRLLNEDVAEVYDTLDVGSDVVIRE